ncbi:SOCS box domain-containing protein [Caerostris darwini]|uniref:SOCS box domain-containing protein n=1 Tax=Caerostris darwini TaxID=1538125 RepID=A0AAV4R9G6_9ARAC|nr:SOCS box domain-containing protein [Caerostris darwini]
MVLCRGFIVQKTAMTLNLSESRHRPTLFILDVMEFNQKYGGQDVTTVDWEHYDENFVQLEELIFKEHENIIFRDINLEKVKNYLKTCRMMRRCYELDEAKRIYHLVKGALNLDIVDSSLLMDLLKTVCENEEMLVYVFSNAILDKHFFKFVLITLKLHGCNSWNLWPDGKFVPLCDHQAFDSNLISQFFTSAHYEFIPILLKYGVQWRYHESYYMDYCTDLNFQW